MRREPSQARVFAELTDALYRQSPTTISGVAVGIAIFALFEWTRQPLRHLLPWLAAHLVALCLRAALAWSYFRQRRRQQGVLDPRAWARRFALALGLSGAVWGAAGVLFFSPTDVMGNAFLMIYDSGVIVMSLIAVSSYLPAFLGFTLPTVAPLMWSCLGAAAPMYKLTGAAQGIFVVLTLIASRRLQRILTRSAELRFQNEDLAEQLRRENQRVADALLAKTKFLAAASHDLRQPLHALNLFVELLDARLREPEPRAFLERISASSRALEGLLNALLDVSRIDAHTLQVRRGHFPLHELFRQLEGELGEQARQKGLELTVKDAGLVVKSDPELLGRVLRNLLSNAVRYTEAGAVILEARASGAMIEVSVADSGPGIPPAEQERVFDEFYQIGNRERDRDKGLGLGLSIVRGLCQLLEHPLRLVSQPERPVGTEFVVTVPAGQAAFVRTRTAQARPEAGPGLAGRTILVIDDEREIRAGMAALLDAWHCQALCAGSADEAEALLAETGARPDAVVCDYRLPGELTGLRALERLEQRLGARLPAVIITGDTAADEIRAVKQSGRPLLFKPVMPGKLRAVITALVSGAGDAPTT
jgi:signal transduction histidine kinase